MSVFGLIIMATIMVIITLAELAQHFWGLAVMCLVGFAAWKVAGAYRRHRDDTFGAPPPF